MSGNIKIGKQLNWLLKEIAKTDGGKSKKEIDSAKGYQQLCDILSGKLTMDDYEFTPTDKAFVNALKVEYEEKYIPKEMIQGNMQGNMNIVEGNKNIFPFPFIFNGPIPKNDDSMPPIPQQFESNEIEFKEI